MRGRPRGSVSPKATLPGSPGQGHRVWTLALCQSDAGAIATVPTASKGATLGRFMAGEQGFWAQVTGAAPGRPTLLLGSGFSHAGGPRPLFGPCPETEARSESSWSLLIAGPG